MKKVLSLIILFMAMSTTQVMAEAIQAKWLTQHQACVKKIIAQYLVEGGESNFNADIQELVRLEALLATSLKDSTLFYLNSVNDNIQSLPAQILFIYLSKNGKSKMSSIQFFEDKTFKFYNFYNEDNQ